MDRTELVKVMEELNVVYGEKKFPLSAKVLTVWFKYLEKIPSNQVEAAVERFVRKSAFPPTISEILEGCREEAEKDTVIKCEIEAAFRILVTLYPGGTASQKEKAAYDSLINGDPERARKACEVTKNIVSGWEAIGETPPPLEEFLRRMRL